MSYEMIDFSETAQLVWASTDVEEKQSLLINAVNNFAFKGKQQLIVKRWVHLVQRTESPGKLDNFAKDLALYKNFKVV